MSEVDYSDWKILKTDIDADEYFAVTKWCSESCGKYYIDADDEYYFVAISPYWQEESESSNDDEDMAESEGQNDGA